MRTKVFDGFVLQKKLLGRVRQEVEGLGGRPCVGVVRVGESVASSRYIQRKREAVAEAGMSLVEFPLDSHHPGLETHLEALLDDLNRSQDIHGVIVQLPLPGLHAQPFLDRVSLEKDIDGLSTRSMHNLETGQGLCFHQCAVQGVVQIMEELAGPLWQQKSVAVVGKGIMIGSPLHSVLKHHYGLSRLAWLDKDSLAKEETIRQSDVVVLCTGEAQAYGRDAFKEGAVVVDTGVYRSPQQNPFNPAYLAFQGDLRPQGLHGHLAAYSPVPGGVGPLCVANVAVNLLKAYKLQHPPMQPRKTLRIDKADAKEEGAGQAGVVLLGEEVQLAGLYQREDFKEECVFLRAVRGVEGHFSRGDYSGEPAFTTYLVDPFVTHPAYSPHQPDFIQQNALILACRPTLEESVHSALHNLELYERGDPAYQPLFLDYENIRIRGRPEE